MSKKFRLLMVLVLVTGLFGGLLTGSTVSADPIPGASIAMPRIDEATSGGFGPPPPTVPPWNTKIQIQNLSVPPVPTGLTVTFWGALGTGVVGVLNWNLPGNAVWTISPQIPAGAVSARVTGNTAGVPLGVTVDRWGPDPTGATTISSSYVGISGEMEPGVPHRGYFAPYVMHQYNNLDTVIAIQNVGANATQVTLEYKLQDTCEYRWSHTILTLAPGETVRVGPPTATGGVDVPFPIPQPGWLGSAYITANEPLAIIVDQLSIPPSTNRGTLLTHRALAYKQKHETEWYADLLYREYSGWDSSIQVQNLTQDSLPTWVGVEFMDASGDFIHYVGDWICRNDTQTFYLPAITDLGHNHPFGYVGAAEIYSLQQVDYPGEHHDEGEPIFVVVDVKKRKTWDPAMNGGIGGWRPTEPGENQGGSYNAHPRQEKEDYWKWAMPFIAYKGQAEEMISRIAIRNNANCNKFYGKVYIYDQGGTQKAVIHTPWFEPKHLRVFDLAYLDFLAPGFVGAAVFEVLGVEQLCDKDNNGHVDNLPIMPSVVVMNYSWERELDIPPPISVGGDVTRIYEAIPFDQHEKVCVGDIFGDVYAFDYEAQTDFPEIDPEANEPIWGADVWVDTGQTDVTSGSGGYELMGVPEGLRTVGAAKCGYFPHEYDVELECGADTKQDLLLTCQGILWGTVWDLATDTVLPDVLVELTVTCEDVGRTYEMSATSGPDGVWWMLVPLCGDDTGDDPGEEDDGPWILTKSKDGYSTIVRTGTEFADDLGFDSGDCVGISSDGCDPADLAVCSDPCLALIDEEDDGDEFLISHAYIQGRVFCDGLVTPNGVFDPGEEQPNSLVRLYRDGIWETEMLSSDPGGYYQFIVDLDRDGDEDIDEENDFTVVAHPASATINNLQPDVHAVRNLNVCGTP